MKNIQSVIQGIQSAVPEKVLTNEDLERMVETSDEWIMQRTGIKERRIIDEDKATSDLAIEASLGVIEKTGTDPSEIDMVICGTVTADMLFPAVSSLVQDAIGAKQAGAFDVGAACAGFIYSLSVADAMLKAEQCKTILVIGADSLTKFVDFTDRSTCVLFGDGAGAAILKAEEGTDRGIIQTVRLSDGSGAKHINIQRGGSRYPAAAEYSQGVRSSIYMEGAETYRFAVKAMGDACCRALELAGMSTDQIDLFVPHQANLRIIDAAADRLKLSSDRVFKNVERYGNTGGASIPIALHEAEESGRLKRGDVVMTVGFGAGLVWGANIIRW